MAAHHQSKAELQIPHRYIIAPYTFAFHPTTKAPTKNAGALKKLELRENRSPYKTFVFLNVYVISKFSEPFHIVQINL